jgi:hypothetical protein
LSVLLTAAAPPAFAQKLPAPAEDTYPADISPPAGTRYPCALTALPRDLPGIPPPERSYVNHAYTRILRATQAKLVLLKALEANAGLPDALSVYRAAIQLQVARLTSAAAPAGLEAFQADVLAAVALQQAFFEAAVPLRRSGKGMAEVYAIPEGRQASARLVAAWTKMQARYPTWSAETRDSIYHHLCALDLF